MIPSQFDEIRRAGSAALAEFRRRHREFDAQAVGWTCIEQSATGPVLGVYATTDRIQTEQATFVWDVQNETLVETDSMAHPRTSYCQRIERPE
ncbi:MAG TPA: hypothetical protein PKD61_39810 [Polyangiaceae bacterium]|nr:hypothetical protein [Polyangiaceae bacterium]